MSYIGISLCVLLCGLIVKEKNRTFGALISVSGVVIVFVSVFTQLKTLIERIKNLTSSVASTQDYIKLMIKVLALTLITQVLSDICRDSGESALAGITETAAKIIIISLMFPLFETVVTIVSGLIK